MTAHAGTIGGVLTVVPASTMIELRGVTKQFAGKRDVVALDSVSLVIPRG